MAVLLTRSDRNPADRDAIFVCEQARLAPGLDEPAHVPLVLHAVARPLPPPHAPAVRRHWRPAARAPALEQGGEVRPALGGNGLDLHQSTSTIGNAGRGSRQSFAKSAAATLPVMSA